MKINILDNCNKQLRKSTPTTKLRLTMQEENRGSLDSMGVVTVDCQETLGTELDQREKAFLRSGCNMENGTRATETFSRWTPFGNNMIHLECYQ